MCGLFGSVGPISKSRGLTRALACHNISRGTHSTGFFTLKDNKKRVMLKAAVPSYELIQNEKFDRVFDKSTYAICGHVRWATMGDICSKNAHPFQIGDTIGSHNGVVSNVLKLKDLTKKNYEVDSEYLIHLINEKESVHEASGSINLVYSKKSDSKGACLRIAKHDNPMAIALNAKKTSLIYSSDNDHLKLAMAQMQLNWDIQELGNNKQILIFCDKGNIVHIEQEDFRCEESIKNYQWQGWNGHDY